LPRRGAAEVFHPSGTRAALQTKGLKRRKESRRDQIFSYFFVLVPAERQIGEHRPQPMLKRESFERTDRVHARVLLQTMDGFEGMKKLSFAITRHRTLPSAVRHDYGQDVAASRLHWPGSDLPQPPPSPPPPPLPWSSPLFRPCHRRRLHLPPTCWITLPGWQWLLAFRRRCRPWSSLGLFLPMVRWISRSCQLR